MKKRPYVYIEAFLFFAINKYKSTWNFINALSVGILILPISV